MQQLQTPPPSPASLPPALAEAIRRVGDAERELDLVYPLFETKLDSVPDDSRASQASLEVRAFAEQVRVAHRAALHALRFWSLRQGSLHVAIAAYTSLAIVIEQFTKRARLDAIELD